MSLLSSHICKNCKSEQDSPFKYCPSCGQKNTDGKISFSEIGSEFFDAIFNINSRTWQTIKNLFIPGKLTLEYFEGKHQKYLHPLRLLIFTSILIIIALSFQDFQSRTNNYYNIKDQILENYERQRLFRILKKITDTTNTIFPEQQTKIITDTILISFNDSLRNLLDTYGDRYGDNINLAGYLGTGSEKREIISKHDFLTMSEDELLEKYKKESGIIDRLIFKQRVKYVKDESRLSAALVGHLTWSILLMMPCLAMVLFLLYIRHPFYYIEHLIFTFHFHAFSFVLITFLIIGLDVFPLWLNYICLSVIEIYLFISMKKIYQQGIGKTLFKFFILNISYLFLLALFMVGTFFVTFLLF